MSTKELLKIAEALEKMSRKFHNESVLLAKKPRRDNSWIRAYILLERKADGLRLAASIIRGSIKRKKTL